MVSTVPSLRVNMMNCKRNSFHEHLRGALLLAVFSSSCGPASATRATCTRNVALSDSPVSKDSGRLFGVIRRLASIRQPTRTLLAHAIQCDDETPVSFIKTEDEFATKWEAYNLSNGVSRLRIYCPRDSSLGAVEFHIDNRVKIGTDDIRRMFQGAIMRDESIHSPGALFRYEYDQLENKIIFLLTSSNHIRQIKLWFNACPEP